MVLVTERIDPKAYRLRERAAEKVGAHIALTGVERDKIVIEQAAVADPPWRNGLIYGYAEVTARATHPTDLRLKRAHFSQTVKDLRLGISMVLAAQP